MTSSSEPITPIFLLSQPRAGSTLVQRVLATYDEVSTVSEPWLLLPLLSALRPSGIQSDYLHWIAYVAIQDFLEACPGGPGALPEELRRTALNLYRRAADTDARYFLDKTPAYHVIAPLLHDVFPDAKFIYLWRNPLSVLASVLETWSDGRFVPQHYRVDLFDGLETLVRSFEDHDNVHGARYEDLVAGEPAWHALSGYLDLDWRSSSLFDFSERQLRGRMGDPVGTKTYQALSAQPLDKWRRTLCNPVRKRWARRYLRWIGERRLAVMGYDLETLLTDLDAAPSSTTGSVSDVVSLAPSIVTEPLRARLLADAGGGNIWRMFISDGSVRAAPRRRGAPLPERSSSEAAAAPEPERVRLDTFSYQT